ncbi:MAG: pyridoxal-dependent decarboxylase [Gammaproteobacteria bacterium]|nr:pyridoxal-dependent decarboxylase [Gammaproteobacteria bacterium]
MNDSYKLNTPGGHAGQTENEVSLDPDDWSAFRKFSHQVLDDMLEYVETVADRPVWQPMPDDVKQNFEQELPTAETEVKTVYEEFKKNILPYPVGNIHPRFWGWVNGNGTPVAMLADLMAGAMNSNMPGFHQSASYVERQVIDWYKEMFDYPADASGILLSGGSVANFVGLAVARNAMADYDIRRHGVDPSLGGRMMFYASSESHFSIPKGVELLGLGKDSYAAVSVDENFAINIPELRDRIRADRAKGLQPVCVSANAGTVGTGAVDDMHALADLCEQEKLWLHVDGAFGAFAKLSETCRSLVDGMERADSIAFDLHKWFYQQYDVACALVKSSDKHRNAFSYTPAYFSKLTGGIAGTEFNFADHGVQLSRSFRALKLWMSIKVHGVERFRTQIEQNIQQARYLAELVNASTKLELLAPTVMNLVNFRYVKPGLDEQQLDKLNAELLIQLQERGIAAPSARSVAGKFSICVANCNHRSRREDFDALVKASETIGDELSAAY